MIFLSFSRESRCANWIRPFCRRCVLVADQVCVAMKGLKIRLNVYNMWSTGFSGNSSQYDRKNVCFSWFMFYFILWVLPYSQWEEKSFNYIWLKFLNLFSFLHHVWNKSLNVTLTLLILNSDVLTELSFSDKNIETHLLLSHKCSWEDHHRMHQTSKSVLLLLFSFPSSHSLDL